MTSNPLRNEALSDLDQAQRLLENVYGYAQDTRNSNLEQLMNAVDAYISEAIDSLNKEF
jgi:hypothetical protein